MTTDTFSFKNHAEVKAWRLALYLFLFFKKALHEVKASGLQSLVSIYFSCPQYNQGFPNSTKRWGKGGGTRNFAGGRNFSLLVGIA